MDDDFGFCPLALAGDVIGDRWTLLILRELTIGNTRFNDIARGLPGISRSLLVQRLKHLERKGVLDAVPLTTGRGSSYHLTPAGKDLFDILYRMGQWSVNWLYHQIDPADVEPVQLMWWMHRLIRPDQLTAERVNVQFDHTRPVRRSFWLVFEHGHATVCLADPGHPVDAVVTCSTEELGRVFSGFQTWSAAVRSGTIEVTGRRDVVRALPNWFAWSPWADDVRARAAMPGRARTA